jgi:hypothetical protein
VVPATFPNEETRIFGVVSTAVEADLSAAPQPKPDSASCGIAVYLLGENPIYLRVTRGAAKGRGVGSNPSFERPGVSAT